MCCVMAYPCIETARGEGFQDQQVERPLKTLVAVLVRHSHSQLWNYRMPMRSDSAHGSLRSSAAFTTLNMAVFAPIASASEPTSCCGPPTS